MTEDEMVGWHHQLNGHEFEQTLGDNEGQESLTAAVYRVAESDIISSFCRYFIKSLIDFFSGFGRDLNIIIYNLN